MNFVKLLFILLLNYVMALDIVSIAQDYPLKFNHISYKDGLSQSPISTIFQDKKGFIWIGNREGLIRYDGYEFITYSHKEEDRNSLSHNLIRVITQDSTGKLWIGTSNGLNVFDPVTEKFTYLDISYGKTVSAVLIDNQQYVWVASYDGLKRVRSKASGKLEVLHLENDDLTNGMPRALMQDQEGKIWIGLANGIRCLDPSTLKMIALPDAIREKQRDRILTISSIREDRLGDIWLSTEGEGLFWYKKQQDTVHNFRDIISPQRGLLSNVIKDILVYDDDNIWFGTRMGLSIFNKHTETFTNYQHDSSDPMSLSQNSIFSFLRDKSGNIWMGTYAGGLNIYYPKFNNFDHVGERIGSKLGLSQPIVNGVLEEDNGALWVAIDGGGLNYIDRKKGISRYFFPMDKEGKQVSHIKTMAKGSNGELYLGTLEGLGVFDRTNGTIDYLPIGETVSFDDSRINVLLSEHGNLWVGTHKLGVWVIDADGKVEALEHTLGNSIQSLYATDDYIWIGTVNGLYRYDKKNKEAVRCLEFNSHRVLSLFMDSKERFWIGTTKGLALFNVRTDKKYVITEETGLVDNTIEAIIEDDLGNIWVSTQKGLSKINYKGGNEDFSDQNLQISNYTSNDGLSNNQFMHGAVLKTQKGELLFGGVNGLTTFYPEKITRNAYLPPVVITDFLIHNKPVRIDTENGPLTSPIDETKHLTLKHDQNAITFKVAALNYINSSNNQYAYKLAGFDKEDEWYYAGNQRTISYTNLPEGTYTLKIKVANNDGVWNEHEKSLSIKVLPPFWKTWWAYTFYMFVFVGLLYLFYSYSVKTERLKHQLDLESISHRMDQQLAQKKMTFFTNISHEIKTPLTMILAPIERLLDMSEGNRSVHGQLKVMHWNGERLLKLINQLLDFRRFDSGNDQLISSQRNIVLFLKEIFLAFKGLADSKGITMKFHAETPELPLWFDPDKLEKVFYNLLSNAIKFTPYEGSISIQIKRIEQQGGDYVSVTVEDNGCGIASEHIDKIFEQFRYYDKKGLNTEGTGLGLAFSKELIDLHQGKIYVESKQATSGTPGHTVFTVLLPTGKKHLSETEISESFSDEEDIIAYQQDTFSAKNQFIQRKQAILIGMEKDKPLMLIVEDNPDVLDFISSSFEDEFDLITAINGEQGWREAQTAIPDIIISDVMMPVMDGMSLCNKLKMDINTSHIPVVLLTARSSTTFKMEGFETGADDYITKPFSISVLKVRVWNLLDSRQKLRDRYQKEVRLEPKNVVITSADDKFLRDLMHFIEQNMDNPELTVDDLSKEVSVARGTLYKKIKALTGQTVNDFVRTVRLKRAAQLLEEARHNINEIAYMVGFSDVNYFRKCFKEQFGHTPKAYSRQSK